MKISVIIPVYNVAPYVERCLRSVFSQGDVAVECIVVEDGSTDESAAVVERFVARAEGEGQGNGVEFHLIRHIRNRGQSAARNTGTAVATGDWIFYLDGDDALEPEALAAMARRTCVDGVGEPDWVQGNFRRVVPQRQTEGEDGGAGEETSYFDPSRPVYGSRAEVVEGFGRLNFTNATNKLIRRDFIRDHGLTFREGLIYEDALWCMEAYPHVTCVATVEGMTYAHHLRGGSIMRSEMTVAKMDSLLYILRRLAEMPDRDANVERRTVFNAVYGMKNLYLGRFPAGYRGQWMAAVWEAGIPHMVRCPERELQPLSRLVVRALGLPCRLGRAYLRALLWGYRIFLRIRGRN